MDFDFDVDLECSEHGHGQMTSTKSEGNDKRGKKGGKGGEKDKREKHKKKNNSKGHDKRDEQSEKHGKQDKKDKKSEKHGEQDKQDKKSEKLGQRGKDKKSERDGKRDKKGQREEKKVTVHKKTACKRKACARDGSGDVQPKQLKASQGDAEGFHLGTDFSGLETPSRALKALGIPFRLIFACEKEASLRKLIEMDCPPDVCLYTDIETRDDRATPVVDCYVAGFSCQPFSRAGKKGGLDDARGDHMMRVKGYIQTQRPRLFVLENVKNLRDEFSELLDDLLRDLRSFGYSVNDKVLNSMKHGGLPQDRDRLYIVGIKCEYTDKSRRFKFPRKLEHEPIAITKLFEHKNKKVVTSPCGATTNTQNINKTIQECLAAGIDPYTEPVIADIDSSTEFSKSGTWHLGYAKTITAARGGTGFYCTSLGRRLCNTEMLRLQGFRPDTMSWEAAGVPRTRFPDV